VTTVEGQQIKLSDLSKILGGSFTYDPVAGKAVLKAEGKEAILMEGSSRFVVSKSGFRTVSGLLPDTPVRARAQLFLTVPSARAFLKQFHAAASRPFPTSLLEPLPIKPSVRDTGIAPFIRNIVIDAGHGDHDAGAIGPGGLREKDINLDVACKLADALGARVAGRVSLTRNDDRFLALSERVNVAKRVKADLFISVHTNSAPRSSGRTASGTEVYFFSSPSDEDARRAERLHGGPFDPRSVGVDPVLFDLMLAGNVIESNKLAEYVVSTLPRKVGLPNRGVKSARFYVMYYGVMSNIPSILIELGFVSNPTEEVKLGNPEWRTKAAEGIAEATVAYLKDLERRYPDGRGWSH